MSVPALVTLGAGALFLLLNSQKNALVNAGQSLAPSISNFQLHKIDLNTRKIAVNLDLNFINPTNTTIKLSNLVVRLNIPVNGNWRTLAQSRPTGKFHIAPGTITQKLRITAPIVLELTNLIPHLLKGNQQQIQVQAFPAIGGHKLEPVEHLINIDPKLITTGLLKSKLGLGLVANQKQKIKVQSSQFEKYWDLSGLQGTDPDLPSGDTFNTIKQMRVIVRKTLNDTLAIAKALKKDTVPETLKAVFNFANDSFNYRLDQPGIEQLRRPARAWKDRHDGIDCDCFSILLSSILTNLNISHSFRKAKYNGNSGYSHIYVIAHHNGKDYALDPVVGKWNNEHPYSAKFDQKEL